MSKTWLAILVTVGFSALGAAFFGEKLSTAEVIGLILAIAALILLLGRA